MKLIKIEYLKIILLSMSIFLYGCSENSSSTASSKKSEGEVIIRRNQEVALSIDPMLHCTRETYPWEKQCSYANSKITHDFFRCKGNSLNPPRIVNKEKESIRYYDCGGCLKHSLPLRNGKEFIYPILIDLLNDLQNKTGKRVIITSGHCCPEHSRYMSDLPAHLYSKHLIGAEVDFYIQGYEHEPQKVIDILLQYYQDNPKYQGKNSFTSFQRYSKENTNVSTLPWFNEEVFIKLFSCKEGRDFDNRHSHPYISIQVRYDWDLKKKVNYSSIEANNFYRY
ncbi:MAG: hypothetical protein Q8K60_00615 [Parachlamydiaceae bacterium]|nr:hypothetical protein [Parachlamydiaceae bacterium]